MANSPHPVLLGPLSEELVARGHSLVITGRDHAQTRDLTLAIWPDALMVGCESPASRGAKVRAVASRVTGLRKVVRNLGANAAASLGSYAQILAARSLRLPVLTLMDYEHQPANHLSFRLADRVVVPRVFPPERLRLYGARQVATFDGFKEEMYLDSVDGLRAPTDRTDSRTLAVFRPPPEGALYHQHGNEVFDAVLREGVARDDVEVVVLPRIANQQARYATMPGVTVPDATVDGLALLQSADVFVGAGGTMSREAALLGTRAYTVFAGRPAAVDAELIRQGSLHDLRGNNIAIDWSPRISQEADRASERRRERGKDLRTWLAVQIEGLC